MPLEIASLKRDKKDGRLKIVFLWIFFQQFVGEWLKDALLTHVDEKAEA